MACEEITIGSEADCENLPVGGTKARLGIINFVDLDADNPYTEDASGKITAINLKPGKIMHLFTGFRNDVKKSDEVINPGVGLNQLKHILGWVVYERTQEQKNNIEKLIRGKFVAVAENKGGDADALEVLGLRSGLEIVPGPIRNAHENGGFFMINMSTSEGDFEPKLPQTLGMTYAAGVTIFDGLLTS